MQSFLSASKFNKTLFFINPTNLYQEYCNAYAYQYMVKKGIIAPDKQIVLQEARISWKTIKVQDQDTILQQIQEYLASQPRVIYNHHAIFSINSAKSSNNHSYIAESRSIFTKTPNLPPNALGQRHATKIIQECQERLTENQVLYQLTSDKDLKTLVKKRLQTNDKSIKEHQTRLKQLKCHAEAQRCLVAKKAKLLEESIVEQYDTPGRPSLAMQIPDLCDKIHDCVEFSAANYKRRKTTIKA